MEQQAAVWKIGSRWGNQGKSVLDLFLNYECVFFGNCQSGNIGNWASVQSGDYFIISDGETPVAIGKSAGTFQDYGHSGIALIKKDRDNFIDDEVRLCPASIVLLTEDLRNETWGIDPQRRFCRYQQYNQEATERIASTWANLTQHEQFDFQIIPRTVSLFGSGDAIFSESVSYRIPKYQRPYSWGENELRRLLESLRDAMQNKESVFLGTMQLSAPIPLTINGSRKAYNIIDGQQRISSFILLITLLEKILHLPPKIDVEEKLQTWVSCGEEQLKLQNYLQSLNASSEPTSEVAENNRYLWNYILLKNLLAEYFSVGQSDDAAPTLDDLYCFLTGDKIKFVVIETHAGLSKTLKIFNTINTSGLSLGTEDVFKIRFYEYLKRQGAPESVFDRISEIYARIEEFNRQPENTLKISMGDILSTCQRIIIAREQLNDATFSWGHETFFERLFDTLLGIHVWTELKPLQGKNVLNIEDLNCIIDGYEKIYRKWEKDAHFRIAHSMIWQTRYGFIWDLPIIARFFGKITQEELFGYTMRLFKFLCPPSLYYAKTVYSVRAVLIEMLKKLPQEVWFPECACPGMSTDKMLDEAFTYQIAWYPKWKNLICRLVEYLKSPEKDMALYNRLWSDIDIEHIQCVTDEDDCETIRQDWGEELNRLGNLALLESSINRSICNRKAQKPEAYSGSCFISIRELKDRVATWTKADAEKRRAENSSLMKDFLLSK